MVFSYKVRESWSLYFRIVITCYLRFGDSWDFWFIWVENIWNTSICRVIMWLIDCYSDFCLNVSKMQSYDFLGICSIWFCVFISYFNFNQCHKRVRWMLMNEWAHDSCIFIKYVTVLICDILIHLLYFCISCILTISWRSLWF